MKKSIDLISVKAYTKGGLEILNERRYLMGYDYSKLNGKIKEVYGTQAAFAEAMNMAQTSLSFKLNNKSEWSQDEMEKAMELLGIPRTSVRTYFFTHRV